NKYLSRSLLHSYFNTDTSNLYLLHIGSLNYISSPRVIVAMLLYVIAILTTSRIIHVVASETTLGPFQSYSDFWFFRLFLNLLGYATIFVPAAILIRYFKRKGFKNNPASGHFSHLVKLFVFGSENESDVEVPSLPANQDVSEEKHSNYWKTVILLFCFVGLQGSYLTWGILQERIMTFEYGKTDTKPGEFFKNSTFLVFLNRISAFIIALLVIALKSQPRHTAPLYKYSYSSFSNIMSSWCQYEALKFVSFPTQVLAKASKIIPVMLMGKLISKKSYDIHEYLSAAMISVGVSIFLLTSADVTKHKDSVTNFSGVLLLFGYMGFDSFTANWQGALFTQYKMSSFQMMAGVNFFSCLLTVVALAEQGGFVESITFMSNYPTFIFHAIILSLCSALGQLFIFYTISIFGAVTFTIIMTLRQAFAIFLSCIIYGHPVTYLGVLGVAVVFIALFLRIYCNQLKKKRLLRVSNNDR
ncbi:adenosine 3'-phospho 5'-phosphosulfate transporter 1-like isoform X1, partial [Argonauta hians]